MMARHQVGTVLELRRYPVKSMAAESLESATVSWHGVSGDRRWAFIQPGKERSGFPWLTIRQKPDLWHHQPRFLDSGDPEASKTIVKTPDGAELEVADPDLAQRLGQGVHVIKQYGGVFDTFPLSLVSLQSVRSLSALAGQTLDSLRFRPNILIDVADEDPFPENRWAGATLSIGTLRFRLDSRDKRCVMVNTDPVSLEANPAVLRAIAKECAAHFGMYGTTVEPGELTIGEPVFLSEP